MKVANEIRKQNTVRHKIDNWEIWIRESWYLSNKKQGKKDAQWDWE